MASGPTIVPSESGVRIARCVSEGKPLKVDGMVMGVSVASRVVEVSEDVDEESVGVVRVMVVVEAATSAAQ